MPALPKNLLRPLIQLALDEDMGRKGDITTQSTISPSTIYTAKMVARQSGVIAGLYAAQLTFEMIDETLTFTPQIKDGEKVEKSDVVAIIEGSARSILMAERVALNFLGHLSGIASATREMADLIAHTKAKVTCTRKTTPGLRSLEKAAVVAGGGINHRFALDDAILIKDNHIAAAGGITKALDRANENKSHMTKIMIEVDNLDQLDKVLVHGGADIVMLDNFENNDLKKGVKKIDGQMGVEASGNVTANTIKAIAETGVDTISSGWITHSAPTLDIGLDF